MSPMELDSEFLREQRLLTVDEVYRMVDAGILDEEEHVELLEGVLLTMSPQGPEHSSITVRVRRRMEQAFGPSFHVRDHSNLRLDERNLPEPDVAVITGSEDEYFSRLPTGRDVRVVVEIAKTSHARDRRKARLYARARIAEYWLIDLVARTITVHRTPSDLAYARVDVLSERDAVEVQDTGICLAVRDLLP